MSKYAYVIEALCPNNGWVSIGGQWALSEAWGYLRCHASTPGPRLALRVSRSDGRVMDESTGIADAGVGYHAGWPTPEQYLRAATRAIVQGASERSGRQYSDLDLRLRALADCEHALALARTVLADAALEGT